MSDNDLPARVARIEQQLKNICVHLGCKEKTSKVELFERRISALEKKLSQLEKQLTASR